MKHEERGKMRAKADWGIALVLGFFLAVCALPAWAANNVKMRVVVVNPSDAKPQTKSVRSDLPKEVKLKDIIDPGNLDIEYDEDHGVYYAYKENVLLAPLETKVYELIMADVWMVPQEKIDGLRKQTSAALENLKETAYFTQGDLVAKTIYGR